MSSSTGQLARGSETDAVTQESAQRAPEQRLRRQAAGLGLTLQKAQRAAAESYRLIDAMTNMVVAGGLCEAGGLSVDDVERALDEERPPTVEMPVCACRTGDTRVNRDECGCLTLGWLLTNRPAVQ